MRNLMVEKRTEAVAAANKARDELSQIVKATKILQHQVNNLFRFNNFSKIARFFHCHCETRHWFLFFEYIYFFIGQGL